jgi:hypothetical protein
MRSTNLERQCYTTGCEAHAAYACMRCGKPLCPQHAHLSRLERRLTTGELTHDLPALAHLPSQFKVYAFCLRCR